jgi:hypothetical protein
MAITSRGEGGIGGGGRGPSRSQQIINSIRSENGWEKSSVEEVLKRRSVATRNEIEKIKKRRPR